MFNPFPFIFVNLKLKFFLNVAHWRHEAKHKFLKKCCTLGTPGVLYYNKWDRSSMTEVLFFCNNKHQQHINRFQWAGSAEIGVIKFRFSCAQVPVFYNTIKRTIPWRSFSTKKSQSPSVPQVPVIVICITWWYALLVLLSTQKNKIEDTHVIWVMSGNENDELWWSTKCTKLLNNSLSKAS